MWNVILLNFLFDVGVHFYTLSDDGPVGPKHVAFNLLTFADK